MKQIQFFAVREDIVHLLAAVERDGPLQYVRTGNSLTRGFETFLRGADLPRLGEADRETGSSCETFLVTRPTVPITVRKITGAEGTPRYCVDQLLNPDTVTLTPAGRWGEGVVLQGVVGTASDSSVSLELMKRFGSAFRRSFSRVQGRFVGPEALVLLRAGKRLTLAAQSPREFDLSEGL